MFTVSRSVPTKQKEETEAQPIHHTQEKMQIRAFSARSESRAYGGQSHNETQEGFPAWSAEAATERHSSTPTGEEVEPAAEEYKAVQEATECKAEATPGCKTAKRQKTDWH